MSTLHEIIYCLGLAVVAMPIVSLGALGLPALFGRPLSERNIVRWLESCTVVGLSAALAILGIMLTTDAVHVPIEVGHWVDLPRIDYHFTFKFVFDRLSVPFVILSFVLCGTVGAFASRYMHREHGFGRFFFLYAVFLVGMIVTSLAGTIETLFAGWELVGLSSALLVAFFHERPAPCRNGLRVWSVYRISDAALLTVAVVLHHVHGHGDFAELLGQAGHDPASQAVSWPDGHVALGSAQALLVGGLLLTAAAGKSALVPFSNWLPRAMEGPTPSSAVFYGAHSVHLGAFLLLRMGPLLDASAILQALVVTTGLLTATYAAFAGRVQTDIKCALSFASLTQVGLIVAEIGLGLRYVALIHILGHACLRTLQFVRAPSLLYDYRNLENAIGGRLPQTEAANDGRVSDVLQRRLYRLALERGYLDALLDDYVVRPLMRLFEKCDAAERRWTALLNRSVGAEPPPVRVERRTTATIEDVA